MSDCINVYLLGEVSGYCRKLADQIDKQLAAMEKPKPVDADGIRPPDVGEGWRELRVGDVVQVGDEFFNGREWHVTTIGGGQIGPRNFPYRRRVTPEAPMTPATKPDADGAWAELRRKACGVASQANAMLVESLQNAASEATTLRSEVERLRLRPEERHAISEAAMDDVAGEMPIRSEILRSLLKRLGGGE